jgi:hypothetical protein
MLSAVMTAMRSEPMILPLSRTSRILLSRNLADSSNADCSPGGQATL